MFDGENSCFKVLDETGKQPKGQTRCEAVGANLGIPKNSYVMDMIVRTKALKW